MTKKPQLQLLVGIALALILVLVALQRQATPTAKRANASGMEQGDEESEYETRASSRDYQVSRIDTEPDPTPVRDYKPSPLFLSHRKEDFEAQKLRAFGTSYIYGIVRGDNNKPI